MKFIKIILVCFISYLPLSFHNAYPDDLRDYYPLDENCKWIYKITREEDSGVREVKNLERKFMGNIEMIKVSHEGNGENGGGYQYLIADKEGIKLYKSVDAAGAYDIYKTPLMILPFNIERVENYQKEVFYSEYNKEGERDDEGMGFEEMRFKGREDIVVPAGKFKNCLKLFTIHKWKDQDGTFGNDEIKTWLAKHVGVVKMIMTATKHRLSGKITIDIEEWYLIKAILSDERCGR